ncbi:hypothetical protein SAMN04488057_102236 [Cyclobacterium lianum]|uniref:Uncharacterized protein n=1 Tax=Cyclobacterium lianum TaxID=388280 RepID=A0A1M7K023_9BACT|nr:hypothetical protein [Cyclobacterium lianum]SHM58682.1 hypothetical protein SAMN04488057_102236 [Cyclobacterium lianum]
MQIHLDQKDVSIIGKDLLEYAETLSEALGMDTLNILKEMKAGDLNHLILTFNHYFSDYIELLDSDHRMSS